MREPISAVIFVRNDPDKLRSLIERLEPVLGRAGEVIVVDQSSTDNTPEVARECGARLLTRTRKGYPDPDRTWAYNQAKNTWVWAWDSDEYPDEELLALVPKLADQERKVHTYWIRRKNLVNGKDIYPILQEDWQPRLFVKGSVQYSDRMHTHPQLGSPHQMWVTKGHIVHERTLEQIEKASENRALARDPQAQQLEHQFRERVRAFLATGEANSGEERRS